LCENGAALAVTTLDVATRSGAGGFSEFLLFSGRRRVLLADGPL